MLVLNDERSVLALLVMGLIMRIKRDRRRLAIALSTAGAVPFLTFPNIAQAGFFDFLFGPSTPGYYEAYPGRLPGADPDFRRHAMPRHAHKPVRRKLIAAVKTDHPVGPQAPTDIMDDESLRHGDAVMTHAGIRIFVGYSGGHHEPEDFRKISEIKKLSKRERSALIALDAPRTNPDGQSGEKLGLVTGRSATERKVTTGETITDPNGRTVRYVGP